MSYLVIQAWDLRFPIAGWKIKLKCILEKYIKKILDVLEWLRVPFTFLKLCDELQVKYCMKGGNFLMTE
jgi:hypothetical protein